MGSIPTAPNATVAILPDGTKSHSPEVSTACGSGWVSEQPFRMLKQGSHATSLTHPRPQVVLTPFLDRVSIVRCNCRGGTPWPPQVFECADWGGHGVPPLQLRIVSTFEAKVLTQELP